MKPPQVQPYRHEVWERDEKLRQFLEKAHSVSGVGDGGESAGQGDPLCQLRMLVQHHIVTCHPLSVTQYLQSSNGIIY